MSADCGGHAALYHPATLLEHAKHLAKEKLGLGEGGEVVSSGSRCSVESSTAWQGKSSGALGYCTQPAS